MTYSTQTLLLVQFLLGAICGWSFGIRKGAIVSVIALGICCAIALAYSGLWIIVIVTLLPFLLVSDGVGLLAGARFRDGNMLTAAGLVSPLLMIWAISVAIENKKELELQQVMEFVQSGSEVGKIGDKDIVVLEPQGWTTTKSPFPFRYEIPIKEKNSSARYYAFVNVTRSWWAGSPTFSLVCVLSPNAYNKQQNVDLCRKQNRKGDLAPHLFL
jgi:hypothetical protein